MFSAGFLDKRIVVLNRDYRTSNDFGVVGSEFHETGRYYANVAYSKGTRAMREGAPDAYDTLLIRTRYHSTINRQSRILYNGTTYQVQTLNADRQADEMQITCLEVVGN